MVRHVVLAVQMAVDVGPGHRVPRSCKRVDDCWEGHHDLRKEAVRIAVAAAAVAVEGRKHRIRHAGAVRLGEQVGKNVCCPRVTRSLQ